MKLRFLVAAAAVLLTASAAHAQVGLYFNPIASRVSNSTVDNSVFSFLGAGSTSRTFWGVSYGAYYDFVHSGNLTVGADLRGTDMHANNGWMKDLLVGVRISGNDVHGGWRPYAEGMFGAGFTKAPASSIDKRKPEFRVLAGLDHPIAKHVDVRAIEVGYGTLQTISSYTVGNGGNVVIPSAKVLSFSSGLVFRF